MRECEPGHNTNISHGEISRREVARWQGRIEAAGSMARFVAIWSTSIVPMDIEIPRPPQTQRQRVEIGALVGEIKLP